MITPGLQHLLTRRRFLAHTSAGLGMAAVASLLGESASGSTHFAPRAKNVIFLFMAGGPSHLDLFDPKPTLVRLDGQTVPESFTRGRRFAFIRPDAKLLGSRRRFQRAGKVGADVSELLPHTAGIVDDI